MIPQSTFVILCCSKCQRRRFAALKGRRQQCHHSHHRCCCMFQLPGCLERMQEPISLLNMSVGQTWSRGQARTSLSLYRRLRRSILHQPVRRSHCPMYRMFLWLRLDKDCMCSGIRQYSSAQYAGICLHRMLLCRGFRLSVRRSRRQCCCRFLMLDCSFLQSSLFLQSRLKESMLLCSLGSFLHHCSDNLLKFRFSRIFLSSQCMSIMCLCRIGLLKAQFGTGRSLQHMLQAVDSMLEGLYNLKPCRIVYMCLVQAEYSFLYRMYLYECILQCMNRLCSLNHHCSYLRSSGSWMLCLK